MSTDNSSHIPDPDATLHGLEVEVAAELARSEARQPELDLPIEEWRYDPADAQLEEVGLRSLLGAVEAMEERPPA